MSWMDVGLVESSLKLSTPQLDRGFDVPLVDLIIVDGQHRYEALLDLRMGRLSREGRRGKARSLLDATLWLSGAKRALTEAQNQWTASALTRRLLLSAEEATGLPAITTPTICVDSAAAVGDGPLLSLGDLTQAAETVEQLWRVALDLLDELVCPRSHEYGPHAPPHESSPCGVIRLAAPLVPRAPGELACSSVLSSLGVLAA